MLNGEAMGNNVADNFEKTLIDKKITILDIAQTLSISKSGVHCFLENLRKGSVSLKTICKYANAININPYELFYESKLVPRKKGRAKTKAG